MLVSVLSSHVMCSVYVWPLCCYLIVSVRDQTPLWTPPLKASVRKNRPLRKWHHSPPPTSLLSISICSANVYKTKGQGCTLSPVLFPFVCLPPPPVFRSHILSLFSSLFSTVILPLILLIPSPSYSISFSLPPHLSSNSSHSEAPVKVTPNGT